MYAVENGTHLSEPTPGPLAPLHKGPAAACELVFNGADEWQAGLQEHLLPLCCKPVDPQGFKANAVIAQLQGNTMAEIRVDASRLLRREPGIEAGNAGPLKLMWQLAGRSRIRQGFHSATLEAGAWTILDTVREYVIDFDQSARCLLLLLPRSQCPGWLGALDALAALPLSASGSAQIARSMLASLLREGAQLDGRSERALHDSVLALIEHALQLELDRRGVSAKTHRVVDFARVQAYILDRLSDTALTVERVAAVFGMSRRNLYNVFAPIGVTPHAFIQNAKLERACELLSDPGWRHAPIMRIAEQCGFADAAHFSRAFFARHGAAPSAWRSRTG